MATQAKAAHSPEHSAGMRDVYQRMLRASGTRGHFVTLGTGRRVHVVEAGDGPPVVHLHGSNTSALSHLMLLEHATAVRSSAPASSKRPRTPARAGLARGFA